MKLISCAEYLMNGSTIRISNQFRVKEAIINENSKRFSLAHTSPLLKASMLEHIELKREKQAYKDLINKGIMIIDINGYVALFLKLL